MVQRTLVLVRHGETDWNRDGRYQGQSDIHLSDTGRAQARALRARLERELHLYDPDETAVVSSDLRRAHETAEIAFGHPSRAIHTEQALREFRYGVFEGLTRQEIEARYPGLFDAWVSSGRDFAMEGGESRAEVHTRAHGAVMRWLTRLPHPHLVVVCHGGVLRQLLHSCFGEAGEPAGLSYRNVATHRVRVAASSWEYDGEVDVTVA